MENTEIKTEINLEVKPETEVKPEKKKCKTCNKGLNKSHWFMIILSFYLFCASIYGTIQLIKNFF